MALDFPANPSDGEVFGSYVWSGSKGVWQSREESATVAITSPTAPLTANNGDLWYNTSRGVTYIYYDDGSSSQWVEVVTSGTPELATKADLTYVDSQDALKANLSGGNSFSGTQNVSGIVNSTGLQINGVSAIPNFLQIVNNGAIATNHSFTIPQKSNCLFFFSPTGYINAGDGPIATWSLSIGGTVRATTKQYFNEAASHRAGPVGMGQVVLNAGTYNANVTTDRRFDANDWTTIWAILIPTA
jgi:hypothetical protein